MLNLTDALHILSAVAIYLLFALGTAMLIKRLGGNLKTMSKRTAGLVPLLGTLANLVILILVLGLLVWVDGKPPWVLGLDFNAADASFLGVSIVATFLLAVVFVKQVGKHSGREVARAPKGPGKNALSVAILLLLVAAQEETLFRGYLMLNLAALGAIGALAVSTLIFALIHLPTNRADAMQFTSWLLGGTLLGVTYLVSGSLWVAIAIHFVTDMFNVLVFDIVGKASLFRIAPGLTAAHRTAFRVLQLLLTVGLLLAVYGWRLQLPG